jgi:hypothetical protein
MADLGGINAWARLQKWKVSFLSQAAFAVAAGIIP